MDRDALARYIEELNALADAAYRDGFTGLAANVWDATEAAQQEMDALDPEEEEVA